MKKTLLYLAAPYSHPDEAVRLARFDRINQAASLLMREGLHVFSPISHPHPIALAGGLPTGWDFWKGSDEAVLAVCKHFVVLRLPGWERSQGVAAESTIANRLRLGIWYVDPETKHLETLVWFLKEAA